MKHHTSLLRPVHGTSLSEYGVVVGVVSIVAIGAVATLGNEVSGTFDESRAALVENLADNGSNADPVNVFAQLANGAIVESLAGSETCRVDTDMDDAYVFGGGRGAIDITERCLVMGTGGVDQVLYNGTPAAFQITIDYISPSGAALDLGDGNDRVIFRSGDVEIDAGGGDDDILVLEGYSAASLADSGGLYISNQDNFIITNGSDLIELQNYFDESFDTIAFDDQVFDTDGFHAYVIGALGSDGDDTIQASDGDDIIYPGAGNDDIYAWYGDDIIVYDSGNDSIHGDSSGAGSDVLDLIKYDKSEVSIATGGTGGNDILITTPDGVITLVNQVASSATRRAIDSIEFANPSDTMTHTDIMTAAGV